MVSTPSRSRQATRIRCRTSWGRVPRSWRQALFFLVSVVLLICFAVMAGGRRCIKKTHSRLPAVGSCRNSIYLRQAPTAPLTTTTTARATCRIFTIIAPNVVKPPGVRQAPPEKDSDGKSALHSRRRMRRARGHVIACSHDLSMARPPGGPTAAPGPGRAGRSLPPSR